MDYCEVTNKALKLQDSQLRISLHGIQCQTAVF